MAFDIFPRLAYANRRISDLESEIRRVREECADAVKSAREDVEREKQFAREMVAAAMLKGGMYPPRTEKDGDDIAPPFREGFYQPLNEAAAEAAADEMREFVELMNRTPIVTAE